MLYICMCSCSLQLIVLGVQLLVMFCNVSVQFENIEAVNDGESFFLMTDVHSLTSCPLKILSSRLLLVRLLTCVRLSC